MSWLSSFMHPGRGYKAAQKEMDKYYNTAVDTLSPYNAAGSEQYNNLNNMIQMLMNPGQLQDNWMKGYQESESAKNAEEMAKQHGLDAASSLGLMGSSPALGAIQTGTTQIGLDARQKYLDDMMQKYMTAANLSSGIFNTGANTANTLANNAMQQGQNSAQMAFNKNNAGGNMFANLVGTVAGAGLPPVSEALVKRWNLSGGQ